MHAPRPKSDRPGGQLIIAAALLPGLAAQVAMAVEIHQLDVSQQEGGYRLLAESTIAAPREYIHAVLEDFEHFHRLTSGITETRYVDDVDTGEPLGFTRIESCVWFFCKTIERTERIESEAPTLFRTRALIELSDFDSYESEWRLVDEAGGTRIFFSAAMEPDFWVPPVIGSWAIRSKLEDTALQMGEAIEYLYANGLTLADIPDE
jgi:hypothetical protein